MLLKPAPIERAHPVARRLILYGPQRHDYGAGSRNFECTSEADNALPRCNLAQAGIATRGSPNARKLASFVFCAGQRREAERTSARTIIASIEASAPGNIVRFWSRTGSSSRTNGRRSGPPSIECCAANGEHAWWRGKSV